MLIGKHGLNYALYIFRGHIYIVDFQAKSGMSQISNFTRESFKNLTHTFTKYQYSLYNINKIIK